MPHRKKRAYHHGNLEGALLEAGLLEAKTSGARNLGVTHLAKLVGVSPMAVYRHFSSGESLKAAISQLAREELAQRMIDAMSTETDVKHRFLATGRAYIQFGLEEPGLFAVAFVDCSALPGRMDEPSSWAILQDSILDLSAAGLVDKSDVEEIAMFCWSAAHGYASLANGTDPLRPLATPLSIEDFLERVWAGVTRGHRVDTPGSESSGRRREN